MIPVQLEANIRRLADSLIKFVSCDQASKKDSEHIYYSIRKRFVFRPEFINEKKN